MSVFWVNGTYTVNKKIVVVHAGLQWTKGDRPYIVCAFDQRSCLAKSHPASIDRNRLRFRGVNFKCYFVIRLHYRGVELWTTLLAKFLSHYQTVGKQGEQKQTDFFHDEGHFLGL